MQSVKLTENATTEKDIRKYNKIIIKELNTQTIIRVSQKTKLTEKCKQLLTKSIFLITNEMKW